MQRLNVLGVEPGPEGSVLATLGGVCVWAASVDDPSLDIALDDLTDVQTAGFPLTDGMVLVWDDTYGFWRPGPAVSSSEEADVPWAVGSVYYNYVDPELGPIWSDSDDGTFTTIFDDGTLPYMAGVHVPPFDAGFILSVSLIVRCSATKPDLTPTEVTWEVLGPFDSPEFYFTSDVMAVPSDGVIHTITVPLHPDDWAGFQATLRGDPAFEVSFPFGDLGAVLNVYQVSLVFHAIVTTPLIQYIDDLADVDTTTDVPTLGATLIWDGVNWVPGMPVVGSLVPLTTVIGGEPTFVWDADNQLVLTEVS